MREKNLYLSVLIFVLFLTSTLSSQTIFQSKIVDSINGVPIPYVTLKIKDTSFGTYSDSLGIFNLNLKTNSDTIIVSSLGYHSKTIILNKQLDRDKPVLLSQKKEVLDEVYISDYFNKGKWSKPFRKIKHWQYAILRSTILFEGTTVKTRFDKLKGKINGVRFNTETPNADMSITIRPIITDLQGESLLVIDYAQTFYLQSWKKRELEFEFKEDVVLPDEGAYIGLEVISVPDNNNYEKAVSLKCSSDEQLKTETTTIQNYVQQSGMAHNFDKIADGGIYIEIKRPK